jgi:hypothetical protein
MPATQPTSPENIEQLTAMGFERDVVVLALREADNNVEQIIVWKLIAYNATSDILHGWA